MELKKSLKYLILIIVMLAFLAPSAKASELARDFNTTYDIDTSGTAHITLEETLTNVAQEALITTRIYQIPTKQFSSIAVFGSNGERMATQIRQDGDYSVVTVPFPSPLSPSQSIRLRVVYDEPNVASRYGSIWEAWIPGITEAAGNKYTLTVMVPKSFGRSLFIDPQPDSIKESEEKTIFEYVSAASQKKTIWMEFGDQQTMLVHGEFLLPDTRHIGDYYKLVIPRDMPDGTQQVVMAGMDPKPLRTECDEEGNYIAIFEPGNLDARKISYNAYVILRPPKQGQIPDAQEKAKSLQYLKSMKYWESDSLEILAKAKEATKGSPGDAESGRRLYDFVIAHMTYDQEKVNGNNERIGALQALKQKSGVCMEYADLLIALSRAAGIPAKPVFGFAYEPDNDQAVNTGHQWVQLFLADRGWTNVDPTWGEIGRDYYGQPSLSHMSMFIEGRKPHLYSYLYYGTQPLEADDSVTCVPSADDVQVAPAFEMKTIIPKTMTSEDSEIMIVKIVNTGNVALHDMKIEVEPNGLTVEESSALIENIPPYGEASFRTYATAGSEGTGQMTLTASGSELNGQEVNVKDVVGVTIAAKPKEMPKPRKISYSALGGVMLMLGLGALRKIWTAAIK